MFQKFIKKERFKAGEVFATMKDNAFIFPLADGSLRQPGGLVNRRSRVSQTQKTELLTLKISNIMVMMWELVTTTHQVHHR